MENGVENGVIGVKQMALLQRCEHRIYLQGTGRNASSTQTERNKQNTVGAMHGRFILCMHDFAETGITPR